MQADLETRVARKLMWRIIPFVMLLYFVSFSIASTSASPR